MQARAKEVLPLDLAALAVDPAGVGAGAAGTTVIEANAPPARGAGTVVRGDPDAATAQIVDFLDQRGLL
jgi:electron transfer flavoprotein alpha/beta subunit